MVVFKPQSKRVFSRPGQELKAWWNWKSSCQWPFADAIWGIPRGPLIFLWSKKLACGSSTWRCHMPQDDCCCSLSRLGTTAHPFVHHLHHLHCVKFLQICWNVTVTTVNSCCLRLPASSSFRRSLISWCRSLFMWQYHKSIRWAFLRMESLCLGMKLISTLSSQDCPHPAPNSTELIAHSCSGLLLGLPLRKISNLGRAAGGDWHVGHDWFSGSERSERWTPKLSHEVSKAKPAHKSHWKDFLSLWKMRFWEKNLREKAFELCFKNLRSWWVLKLVRPCCSLWLQWCCTRSAWSSNVFSRRAQRQRPSNWRPLLETWWNPMP